MSVETITDAVGAVVGRMVTHNGRTTVTDPTGRILGTADSTGTRDAVGRKLSCANVPGMLLK